MNLSFNRYIEIPAEWSLHSMISGHYRNVYVFQRDTRHNAFMAACESKCGLSLDSKTFHDTRQEAVKAASDLALSFPR